MSIYKKYGIYVIRNIINNKIYIGKTMTSFGDRWDCHKAQLNGGYHDNPHLQKAWNKYGESGFVFEILHDCTGESVEFVNNLEIKEIKIAKNSGISYNIHDGGDGGLLLGKHLSEETKRKIGEKNRINMTGRKASNETRMKMSKSHKERISRWTHEDRERFGKISSEKARGYKWSDESREKMAGNKNGAKYSVEQVKEIRRLHEVERKGYTEISKIMDIPRPAVYLIGTYRRWKDV